MFWSIFFTEQFRTTASISYNQQLLEAVARRCSVKKVFLEMSQNSQENTCARASFYNKVAGLRPSYFYRTSLVATSELLTNCS